MAWRWVVFKGTRVLARCEPSGEFSSEGGRVEIRYRPDGKPYRAASGNLSPADETILPDDHCAAFDPATAPAPTPRATVSRPPPPSAEGIVAYTDGACSGNPGPAGLGVVLCVRGTRRELSEYLGAATNNVAELTAILRALEALDHSAEEISVYTDSQYAIGVLQKNWKPKVNQELIATTKARMRAFTRLRLVYVKGHAGIALNERADELARRAVADRRTHGWSEVGHADALPRLD